jgi:hypothetical protein
LKKAYGAADYATANAVVYKIGRLVARERLTAATSTDASIGGIFLIDVLRCLTDGAAQPEDITEFVPNATAVVKSGIWEIRGGTTNKTVPAAGRVIDNTSGLRDFGRPRWGVELGTATSWGGNEYVVFGFPTAGAVVVGSAANINTNEVPASGFELGTIPSGTSKLGLRVGVCVNQDPSQGTANRVVHDTTEVLDYSALTALCTSAPPDYVASATLNSSWYASAVRRAGAFLAPKLLFAQGTDCTLLCVGGLPSDWSPFTANAITAANIVLTITKQPSGTVVVLASPSATPNDTLVVHAAINGVAVPGVSIDSITVAGNSGTPAGAIVTSSNLPISTDKNGNATVLFSLGKAGGYTVTVYGSLDGFLTKTVTSVLFNVKNK